jgi:putative transposase
MKIMRGYKTELDPTGEHYVLLCQCAGIARYAYNYGLARKEEAYKNGEKYSYANDLQRELTARKHDDLPWLDAVSKWIVQNALRDLDVAFDNFFKKCKLKAQGKHHGTCGYPKFKRKHNGRGSFRLDCPVHVFDGCVQLPKLGKIRLKEHGYIPTWGVKVLSATVSEKAGRWFVSVQVEEEHAESLPATGTPIGIDVGIKTLATLSTGETFDNPKALRSRLKALKRASRQHSRKKRGSNNRKKAQRKLATLHMRIATIRKDALHKVTSQIVAKTKPHDERPSVIVLEDLNVKGMLKNRKLARAISDVGLGEFKRQVTYKAAYAGIEVKQVSRWYASSQYCHCCGWKHEELTLADRVFVCQDCGNVCDRDYNAAVNLASKAEHGLQYRELHGISSLT